MTVVKHSSFWFILFLLLVPSGCLQIQLGSSRERHGVKEDVQVPDEKFLPRKLGVLTGKVTVTVQKNTEKDSASENYNPQKINLSDKLEQKKPKVAAPARPHPGGHAETWKQRAEDMGDSLEFFTMDYHKVRGRLPIHN